MRLPRKGLIGNELRLSRVLMSNVCLVLPAPKSVERQIDSDAKQPWPERRWLIGDVETGVSSEAGLLHYLLGNRAAADNAPGRSEKRIELWPCQRLEPLPFACLVQICPSELNAFRVSTRA